MKTRLGKSVVIGLGVLLAAVAIASSKDDIIYPVAELGNCQSEEACLNYCDNASRARECLAFAKKHNLIPSDEIEKGERLLEIGSGPGGCNSQRSCETYCNDVSHIDECIAFAQANGFLSGKELEEAKRIQDALRRGAKLPGDCRSKAQCEAYCRESSRIDECLAFAESAGFMPPEELERAKKFAEFMKKGETPGNCRSEEECEKYCFQGDNFEECVAFAERAGFLSEEEREIIRKTGGHGPGGCRGKKECEAYCQTNQEQCLNWARDNGLMGEEEFSRLREGLDRFKQELERMPPEVVECLRLAMGSNFDKLQAGEPVFERELGEKMRVCFESFAKNFGGSITSEGEFMGPGGCKSQEECMAYCQEHRDDPQCAPLVERFGPADVEFQGPGGCKTPEGCQEYCRAHPEECTGFRPPHPESSGTGVPEEFRPPEGSNILHEGTTAPPPEFAAPPGATPEEFQQQYQEEYQRQYEEEYRRQYEEQLRQQQQYQAPTVINILGTLIAPFLEILR